MENKLIQYKLREIRPLILFKLQKKIIDRTPKLQSQSRSVVTSLSPIHWIVKVLI